MLKTKRFGAFILTLILLSTLMPRVLAVPPNGNEQLPPAGMIWDSWETIEANLLELPLTAFESVLPSSVNLTHLFPTPGDQGRLNSCVGWAVAYALKSNHEEVIRGWGLHTDEHLFSPSFVWNQRNGGENRGMAISSAFDILVEQGVATLASFPHVANDYLTQPTVEQRTEAANFRDGSWYTIRGIESIKRRLVGNAGVVIGIELFPDFDAISPSNPVYDTVSGTSRGSHAVTLIGYDDELRAFKFINSYGTNWGLGGYGWISYDLMSDEGVNNYGVVVGFIMEPRDIPIQSEADFDFTVSFGGATIIGYTGSGGEVVIPDTLGGYPVIRVGNDVFQGNTTISDIVISDNVTSIAPDAFRNCTSLTDVVIGDGVTTIGSGAFFGCVALTDTVIGNSVMTIGNAAFMGCTVLTSIVIPDSVISIGSEAFRNCTSLTDAVISNNVLWIGNSTFRNCWRLTEIVIPESVTWIDDYAFEGTRIMSVVIPDGVTYIGWNAFELNHMLASVTFNSLTPPTLSTSAFSSTATIYVPFGTYAVYRAVPQLAGHTIVEGEAGEIEFYTVTFDLNGGTRTGGGELEQTVLHGRNATPPTAEREGYYLGGWNGVFTNVTSDRTITAVWNEIIDTAIDITDMNAAEIITAFQNAVTPYTTVTVTGAAHDLTDCINLNIPGNGTVIWKAQIASTATPYAMSIQGNGTITIANDFTSGGGIYIVYARMIVNQGVMFTNSHTIDNFGTIDNYGTINNNGTINYVTFENSGMINNNGTIDNCRITNNDTGEIINNGFFFAGDIFNSGTITNNSIFDIDTLGGAPATIFNSGGTIVNTGTITTLIAMFFNWEDGMIFNYGVIEVNWRLLNVGTIYTIANGIIGDVSSEVIYMPPIESATITDVVQAGEHVVVTLDVEGAIPSASGYIFYAAYDDNGRLLYMSARQIIRKSADEYRFNVSQIPERADMIKVFIWEDFATMRPLGNSMCAKKSGGIWQSVTN